jgi:hypothetical protein
MQATVISARIEIDPEKAISIVTSGDQLGAYQAYLEEQHGVIPASISETDVSSLKRSLIVHLGERELLRIEGGVK